LKMARNRHILHMPIEWMNECRQILFWSADWYCLLKVKWHTARDWNFLTGMWSMLDMLNRA
jgi:hypothetical protein